VADGGVLDIGCGISKLFCDIERGLELFVTVWEALVASLCAAATLWLALARARLSRQCMQLEYVSSGAIRFLQEP
jgi:hypothetical protein